MRDAWYKKKYFCISPLLFPAVQKRLEATVTGQIQDSLQAAKAYTVVQWPVAWAYKWLPDFRRKILSLFRVMSKNGVAGFPETSVTTYTTLWATADKWSSKYIRNAVYFYSVYDRLKLAIPWFSSASPCKCRKSTWIRSAPLPIPVQFFTHQLRCHRGYIQRFDKRRNVTHKPTT